MRPKQCYWTRTLELELINFVRSRDYIWKQTGNTNHHIQQKYKAYAEFASMVGHGFTARSVRDRWVNIRSTFNHNLNKVIKSKVKATTSADIYVPCWPLWQPLQFLKESQKNKEQVESNNYMTDYKQFSDIKEELHSDVDTNNDINIVKIRQRGQRTNRPRQKNISLKPTDYKKKTKCKKILDDLLKTMKPLNETVQDSYNQSYWFFGKHVAERLNCMRYEDALCASKEIMDLLTDNDISPQDISNVHD